MKEFLIKQKHTIISIIAGMIFGIGYWYFVGCSNGSCAISSKWYNSLLYFGVLGYLVSGFFKKDNSVSEKSQHNTNQ